MSALRKFVNTHWVNGRSQGMFKPGVHTWKRKKKRVGTTKGSNVFMSLIIILPTLLETHPLKPWVTWGQVSGSWLWKLKQEDNMAPPGPKVSQRQTRVPSLLLPPFKTLHKAESSFLPSIHRNDCGSWHVQHIYPSKFPQELLQTPPSLPWLEKGASGKIFFFFPKEGSGLSPCFPLGSGKTHHFLWQSFHFL